MNCRAAPFISEHGEQRLHTDTLYTEYKSPKKNISIYTYWKLAEPLQFKQLQNAAPQALIDGANMWMAMWLYNIVLSENLASQSSIIEARDSILASRDSILASRNLKCLSFMTRGSSLELRWSSVNLPLSGTVKWQLCFKLPFKLVNPAPFLDSTTHFKDQLFEHLAS